MGGRVLGLCILPEMRRTRGIPAYVPAQWTFHAKALGAAIP